MLLSAHLFNSPVPGIINYLLTLFFILITYSRNLSERFILIVNPNRLYGSFSSRVSKKPLQGFTCLVFSFQQMNLRETAIRNVFRALGTKGSISVIRTFNVNTVLRLYDRNSVEHSNRSVSRRDIGCKKCLVCLEFSVPPREFLRQQITESITLYGRGVRRDVNEVPPRSLLS